MSRITDFMQGRSRRDQILIVGGVVLLVVVVGYMLLSSGGGGTNQGEIGTPLTPRTTPTATPTSGGTAVGGGGEGRDPFQPAIGASGSPNPTATPSSGGPGGPNPGGQQRRVTLIDVFKQDGTQMATVEVADKTYTVKKGDTFATDFKVVDLTSNCGTFLFGDERFSLCVGQEVLK